MKKIILSILILAAPLLIINSSFGYGNNSLGFNTTPNTFSEDLGHALELGLGILRVPLSWQSVEPEKGEFNWVFTDQLMDSAASRGVEVLFVLRSNSGWGTNKFSNKKGAYNSSSAPRDMKDWVNFLELLARRYKDRKVYYEIENEVNTRAFWSGTQEEYLLLLKESYRIIKSCDPDTKVLSSAVGCGIVRKFKLGDATANNTTNWMRAVLSTKAFDVVSVHNYYFPSEIVVNDFTFSGYLDYIRKLMQEAGVSKAPIWITEIGYVSKPAKATGRRDLGNIAKQGLWLKEAYEQGFSAKVERIFWLLITDRNEPYFGSMGLRDIYSMPRPAWGIMQEFVK